GTVSRLNAFDFFGETDRTKLRHGWTLGLRIFLPRFPYLFVQVLNLAVDDFEKFHVLADNTRSVPAKLLCPPGHPPQPMPNHAGSLNIPLSVERVQLVDHGGPIPHQPHSMGEKLTYVAFFLSWNPHRRQKVCFQQPR